MRRTRGSWQGPRLLLVLLGKQSQGQVPVDAVFRSGQQDPVPHALCAGELADTAQTLYSTLDCTVLDSIWCRASSTQLTASSIQCNVQVSIGCQDWRVLQILCESQSESTSPGVCIPAAYHTLYLNDLHVDSQAHVLRYMRSHEP